MKKIQRKQVLKEAKNMMENKIENLHASKGDFKGEVDLIWNPAANALSYVVQISKVNGKDEWKHVDIVTKSHCTVTGLQSNKMYKFRTSPVSHDSKYVWSNTVTEKAA